MVDNEVINNSISYIRELDTDEVAEECAFKRERAIADYNNRYELGVKIGFIEGYDETFKGSRKACIAILNLHYGYDVNIISTALNIGNFEVSKIISDFENEYRDEKEKRNTLLVLRYFYKAYLKADIIATLLDMDLEEVQNIINKYKSEH